MLNNYYVFLARFFPPFDSEPVSAGTDFAAGGKIVDAGAGAGGGAAAGAGAPAGALAAATAAAAAFSASDFLFLFGADFFFFVTSPEDFVPPVFVPAVPAAGASLLSVLLLAEASGVVFLGALDFGLLVPDEPDLDFLAGGLVRLTEVLGAGAGAGGGGLTIPSNASSSKTRSLPATIFDSLTRLACRFPSFCNITFCKVKRVKISFRTESYMSQTRFVGSGLGDIFSSAKTTSIRVSNDLFNPTAPPVDGGNSRPDCKYGVLGMGVGAVDVKHWSRMAGESAILAPGTGETDRDGAREDRGVVDTFGPPGFPFEAAIIWPPAFFSLRSCASINLSSFRNSISSNSSALLLFQTTSI